MSVCFAGSTSLAVYLEYFRYVGRAVMWVILAGLLLGQAVFVVSEYWLATWARQSYQVCAAVVASDITTLMQRCGHQPPLPMPAEQCSLALSSLYDMLPLPFTVLESSAAVYATSCSSSTQV